MSSQQQPFNLRQCGDCGSNMNAQMVMFSPDIGNKGGEYYDIIHAFACPWCGNVDVFGERINIKELDSKDTSETNRNT